MHVFKVTTRKIGLEENTKELSGQLKPPVKVQPSVAVQFQTQVADHLLGGSGTSGYFSKRGKIRGGFLRLWVCCTVLPCASPSEIAGAAAVLGTPVDPGVPGPSCRSGCAQGARGGRRWRVQEQGRQAGLSGRQTAL